MTPVATGVPTAVPTAWGGRRAQAWTRAVLARYGRVCALGLRGCTVLATTGDHVEPFSERPDLAYDIENGRPACLHCNSSRGVTPLDQLRDDVGVVDERKFFESSAPRGRQAHRSPPRNPQKFGQNGASP